jgi:hypothetical protein
MYSISICIPFFIHQRKGLRRFFNQSSAVIFGVHIRAAFAGLLPRCVDDDFAAEKYLAAAPYMFDGVVRLTYLSLFFYHTKGHTGTIR